MNFTISKIFYLNKGKPVENSFQGAKKMINYCKNIANIDNKIIVKS